MKFLVLTLMMSFLSQGVFGAEGAFASEGGMIRKIDFGEGPAMDEHFVRNEIARRKTMKNINSSKLKSEILLLISLFVIFIFSVAYVGGPIETGKNIIRLTNLVYPLIILIGALSINLKKHSLSSMRFYLFSFLFILWSFHPTFSKIKLFNFIKI